jgi:hypothetical protein
VFAGLAVLTVLASLFNGLLGLIERRTSAGPR